MEVAIKIAILISYKKLARSGSPGEVDWISIEASIQSIKSLTDELSGIESTCATAEKNVLKIADGVKWVKGSRILDSFRNDNSFWSHIEGFVGVAEAVVARTQAPKVRKDKDWEANDFFRHLSIQVLKRPAMTPLEQFGIYVGLKYLEAESMRGRGQRDKTAIQYTWKTLHPLLEKFGLLNEFQSEQVIKKRVRSFVSGRFL